MDEEYDLLQRITNDYLDKEPFISTIVDGWENQDGDAVKMVNAIDSKCHSFLVGIVDDPYKKDVYVKPVLRSHTRKLWNLNSTVATTLKVVQIIRV